MSESLTMNNDSSTSLAAQINETDFKLSTIPYIPIIFSVILSAIDVFTITANIVVIIAVVRFGPTSGGDVTRNNGIATMMMTSLALSDGLIGIVVMPLGLAELINNGKWDLGSALCELRCDLNNTLTSVSIFHILFMAIERYIAICTPMKYKVLSNKLAYIMIGTAWLLPVVFNLLPTINGWHQSGEEDFVRSLQNIKVCIRVMNKIILMISVALSFYFPLAATYTLYFLILRDVRDFSKRRKHYLRKNVVQICDSKLTEASQTKPRHVLNVPTMKTHVFTNKVPELCTDRPTENTIFTAVPRKEPMEDRAHTNLNLRAYRTIGATLVCFTVCWLPLGLTAVALTFGDYKDFPIWVGVLLNWVSILSSALNPVLYCGNRSVRRAVNSLLCYLKNVCIHNQ